jgi:hypothetical protein
MIASVKGCTAVLSVTIWHTDAPHTLSCVISLFADALSGSTNAIKTRSKEVRRMAVPPDLRSTVTLLRHRRT